MRLSRVLVVGYVAWATGIADVVLGLPVTGRVGVDSAGSSQDTG